MASVNQSITAKKEMNITAKKDWLLAHPWLWQGAGFAVTLWSLAWTLAFGATASDDRVIVLAGGLLLASAGLWLRWRDRQTAHLAAWRAPIALFLGAVFALACLGVTALFVLSFFMPDQIALKPAPLFLAWISAAPLAFCAARRCFKSNPEEHACNTDEEVALALVVMAGTCLAGSFTLCADRDSPADWDSLRLFLRVFTVVCLYGAALVVVSTALRRIMLSVLFTIHFLGISSAVLSAPPSPWIVQQAWMRMFRPYLEFVYLNNAYHFYAPEPGPASYLWFRVIFETPEGKDQGLWYKIPQLDANGRIEHRVALEYQRFLSITDSISAADPLPPENIFNLDAKLWQPNPFWTIRLNLAAMPNEAVVMVGAQQPQDQLRIPLQLGIPYSQQVWKPNDTSRRLLGSHARFVARKYQEFPEHPDWKVKSIKIYRVIHIIPPVQWFENYIPPTDPDLYRAFYAGNFKTDGSMAIDQDPYLYWLLPSQRVDVNDPDSEIRDYARRHAGDPQWIRPRGKDYWVEPGQK
jgi:hypothetical protein